MRDNPCATAADMKTTKLHVGNVQVQIEKRKNDARVVYRIFKLPRVLNPIFYFDGLINSIYR